MKWPWKKSSATNTPAASAASGDGQGDDDVNILRFMRPECICTRLSFVPAEPGEDETDSQREKRLVNDKEGALQELTDILDQSGQIVNPTKFYKDMVNRERKATTAIAPGIAIPHVRSMQVRQFIMGFAKAEGPDGTGIPFHSLDGSNTRLFFMLASPPYEDKLYLRVYRQFAEMIRHDWIVDSFLEAETPDDVLGILRGYIRQ